MKSHHVAAFLVLIASAVWIFTGEFNSVGSSASEDQASITVAARQAADEANNPRALQTVGVAKIPSMDHARSVRISGITEADKKIEIPARTSGIISELLIKQGDVVKAGDLILTLAPEGRDVSLASAEQSLEQAQIDLQAKEQLVERGTLGKLTLDQAKSTLRAAESQVENARAEMDRLRVVAAFDGVIDALMVEEGGAVQAGTPIATLISLDPIIGVGEVNESDLGIVTVGKEADLRLVTGEIVTGKIRYISREAQPNTRTYTVEIEVANPDLAIPSGMTTEVILRGDAVLATPVPRSIVTLGNTGELGIRSLDDEDKVVFHPIDIVDDSTGALILGGIPSGVRIIVSGQNLVTEGQTVEPSELDPETIERLVAEVRNQVESQ
ncbi:MAG: efflux RND transporter periplasmic adaptor subunit [Pseudomonadota bacterium]